MLDRLTSPENLSAARRNERRAWYMQIAITIILILALAAWGIGLIRTWIYPTVAITKVTIADAQALSPTVVCPGDTLTVNFTFSGDEAATLVVDATTTDATSGRTVAYSTPHRLIYDGVGAKPVLDEWVVTELPPGKYLRNVAVSSGSKATAFASDSVAIEIGADCP